jgi:hypothetical protein
VHFQMKNFSTGFPDNIPWMLSNLDKCSFTTDHSFFHHEFRKHVINRQNIKPKKKSIHLHNPFLVIIEVL